MKVKLTKTAGAVFEYFLYAAMILETGLAAVAYKFLAEAQLSSLRIYLIVLYFGFLSWSVFQLNRLHRARKQFQTEVAAEPELVSREEPKPLAPAPSRVEAPKLVLGLSGAQVVVVLVVFLTSLVIFTWALETLKVGK